MAARILDLKKFRLLLIVPILILAILSWASPGQAISPWSEPLQLNEEDATTPFILADSSGGVHVFWGSSGSQETTGAIFYRRLTDRGWSETIDILASPGGGSAIYPSAVIDAQGIIHLVWAGDKLYYSQAHLSQALHPRGWSTPYQMTNYGVTNGAIQLGMDGSLNVLFGSRGSTPAVYLLHSEDHGEFWNIAVQVSMPQDGAYALTCNLAVDAHGRLHATWAEALQTTIQADGVQKIPPSGVYYARSDDGGAHWSYPHTVAQGEHGGPVVGVDAQEQIHILWSGSGSAAGEYHTLFDQQLGEWHPAERVLPGGEGLPGTAAMVRDSSGRLHIAISAAGQTEFAQASPGEIVTLSWYGGNWGDVHQATLSLMDPRIGHSQPALAISEGDMLHLVWLATDRNEAQKGGSMSSVWYSVRQLSSPHIDPQPVASLVAPLATTTSALQPTSIPITPTPWVVTNSGFLPQTPVWYKQAPVIFGATITLLLLIVVLRSYVRKRIHAR